MMTVLQHQKQKLEKRRGVAGEVLNVEVGGAKAPWAELMKLSL